METPKPKMSELRKVANALAEVVKVIEFGKIKHPADDWDTNFTVQDHEDAAFRHSLKRGLDSESGIDHRAHAILRFLFALESDIAKTRTHITSGTGQPSSSTP